MSSKETVVWMFERFSDDSEKLWCSEDDTTKGVWVTLEALFEEERRSRWLKVGCAKYVRGQVGKLVMSYSYLCSESLRNSKDNSCDTLHETLGCGYQRQRVKTCTSVVLSVELGADPMWLQESCPCSEVTSVTWFASRDRYSDDHWQSHHGSMTMFRMHPQIRDLESVMICWDVRILDYNVQTWKVWVKEEKWSMIGERSGLERRWRYQDSRMITKNMTRSWRSIRTRRVVCA